MMHKLMHETFMSRCLDLAMNGSGHTSPNPLVGAVIVHDGKIIGEGFHEKFGGAHAEVNAVNSVSNKALLRESVLYVNLEPCAHTGKTPPCTTLIIQNRIPEVIIGITDPNPLVSGKGISALQNAGLKITTEILAIRCSDLNRRFITFHKYKRPYIILKWAQTSDGFIDVIRNAHDPLQPTWISNDISRMLVHKWRSEEQSILVGTETARLDNPRLNVREWTGKSPVRLVLDRDLRLNRDLHVFDNSSRTVVFNSRINAEEGQTTFVRLDFGKNFPENMLEYLYTIGIQSMLIEGGKQTLETFIHKNLWDEARVFKGEKQFDRGIKAPVMNRVSTEKKLIRNDVLLLYQNK